LTTSFRRYLIDHLLFNGAGDECNAADGRFSTAAWKSVDMSEESPQ